MSAVISPCGQYRFKLEREVQDEGKVFAFFGINPSTADAETDDATIRKWRGFTKRNGGSRFIVGNIFAFRATDVRELAKCSDPFGLGLNSIYIDEIISEADIIVPCWGSKAKVPSKFHSTIDAFAYSLRNMQSKPVMCFGFTSSGDPKHPLMLGYDTPLVSFSG